MGSWGGILIILVRHKCHSNACVGWGGVFEQKSPILRGAERGFMGAVVFVWGWMADFSPWNDDCYSSLLNQSLERSDVNAISAGPQRE